MKITKSLYEAPALTEINVRLEQCILDVSPGVNYSNADGGVSGNDVYNDYTDL